MTETKTPKEPKDARERMFAAMRDLTPEDRAYFLQQGLPVPAVGQGTIEQARKYGYRCKYCNHVALEFVGTSFADAGGGETELPSTALPIGQIPWAQPLLPAHKINRAMPICQCCGQRVVLHRGCLIKKYIWDIELLRKTQHAGFEALRKHKREKSMNLMGENLGTDVPVSHSYDGDNDRLLRESKARIEQASPGITNAVEQTAAELNLLDGLQNRTIKVGKELKR